MTGRAKRSSGSIPVLSRTSSRSRLGAKPRFKLLAIDLDGTLLDRKGTPHEEDVNAIRALRERGAIVTILTGRLYSGTRDAAQALGLDGPVGCADGSHIVDAATEKTLVHRGIRGRDAERLKSTLLDNDLVTFAFVEDAIVHDERGADYLPFVKVWSTDLRFARRVTDHPLWRSTRGMTAIVALGSELRIDKTHADLLRDVGDSMHLTKFAFRKEDDQWGLVARANGGTKGTALSWMSDHYGIDLSETVCVGDWHNDVPMMTLAGRSFAMGQSPDEVKRAASDVLERNVDTGGGIAEAIDRAFGSASEQLARKC